MYGQLGLTGTPATSGLGVRLKYFAYPKFAMDPNQEIRGNASGHTREYSCVSALIPYLASDREFQFGTCIPSLYVIVVE